MAVGAPIAFGYDFQNLAAFELLNSPQRLRQLRFLADLGLPQRKTDLALTNVVERRDKFRGISLEAPPSRAFE